MKLTTTALGLVLALAGAPVAAQYNTPPSAPQQMPGNDTPTASEESRPQTKASAGGLITHQPKLSGSAGKAIIELQTAVNSNDTAAIPAKLTAAKAAAKTAEDRYAIAILELKAANAAKNTAGMAAGLEAMLASGDAKQNELPGLYQALAQVDASLKQWPKATDAYNHVLQLDPNNIDAVAGLAETQVSAGQPAAALPFLQRGIKLQEAGGRKAPEAWYKRAVSVAYEARLASAPEISRQWVAAYPSADSWHNSIAIYRNLNKPDVEGTLVLMRLMQATNSLQGASDYSLFATASAEQSNFNEAKAVIDAGIAARQVDAASPLFRDTVAGLKTKPIATEADLNAALKMSPTATAQIRIGDRFYGSGNYAKAAEVYRAALAKPGVDPNLANLHLGMALARTGDKAGATAAFNAVTGPNAEIAKYWLLYLSTRG